MSNIIVTGAGREDSLGHLVAHLLQRDGHNVCGWNKELSGQSRDYWQLQVDVRSWLDVKEAAQYSWNYLQSVVVTGIESSGCDILVNCAGMNLIDYLEDLEPETWDEIMSVNSRGIFYCCKALLPQLKESKGTILNIISNASHNPMTASLAYNASKGAAHIMTLQLARELTKLYGITVFGISPNKLSGTGMSKDIDEQVSRTRGWEMDEVQRYQKSGLLSGEETDPYRVAELVVFLLKEKDRHKYLTGCVLPYGA